MSDYEKMRKMICEAAEQLSMLSGDSLAVVVSRLESAMNLLGESVKELAKPTNKQKKQKKKKNWEKKRYYE